MRGEVESEDEVEVEVESSRTLDEGQSLRVGRRGWEQRQRQRQSRDRGRSTVWYRHGPLSGFGSDLRGGEVKEEEKRQEQQLWQRPKSEWHSSMGARANKAGGMTTTDEGAVTTVDGGEGGGGWSGRTRGGESSSEGRAVFGWRVSFLPRFVWTRMAPVVGAKRTKRSRALHEDGENSFQPHQHGAGEATRSTADRHCSSPCSLWLPPFVVVVALAREPSWCLH